MKDDGGTVTPDTTESKQPTPDEAKAARKSAIEKLSIEAQKNALNSAAPADGTRRDDDDEVDVDLDGVDDKTAKAIRKTLREAREKDKSIRTIAQFGLEQARKAKAFEIGLEFGLDRDEVEGIQKALSGANNPDAIDLSGREIVMKLKEDGTFAPQAAPKGGSKKGAVDGDNLPPVDQGRSSGANRVKALEEKIDAIDPADPNAEAELAKLYGEVQREQKAFAERQRRRNS